MSFSSNLLKIVTQSISSCLCDQFNKTIDTVVYPESLKFARVIPIIKEAHLSVRITNNQYHSYQLLGKSLKNSCNQD